MFSRLRRISQSVQGSTVSFTFASETDSCKQLGCGKLVQSGETQAINTRHSSSLSLDGNHFALHCICVLILARQTRLHGDTRNCLLTAILRLQNGGTIEKEVKRLGTRGSRTLVDRATSIDRRFKVKQVSLGKKLNVSLSLGFHIGKCHQRDDLHVREVFAIHVFSESQRCSK